jgi:isocitrate/isopropylmalate dehydrogenase
LSARIVLLPGDGIGAEITAAARRLLEAVGEFEFDERELGGASIDAHGTALTDETLAACRGADAACGVVNERSGADEVAGEFRRDAREEASGRGCSQ